MEAMVSLDYVDVTIIAVVRQAEKAVSLQDLCDVVPQIKSKSAMRERLKKLKKAGYINFDDRKHRTITVTESGREIFPEFKVVGLKEGK
jgi:predicted MarR family transcription regulator